MEEILDLIDEKDCLVGQMPYTECHQRRRLHRVVHTIVFSDKTCKKVLVQKRSTKVDGAGKLDFPGGHVKCGQTYLEAMEMEFSEEVNRDALVSFLPLAKFRKTSQACDCIVQSYTTIFKGPFHDNDEVDECMWMDIMTLAQDVKKYPEKYTTAVSLLLNKFLDKR
jgi:8-oxo-dGTP pyrophosphatase MutT (NUDIX family)